MKRPTQWLCNHCIGNWATWTNLPYLFWIFRLTNRVHLLSGDEWAILESFAYKEGPFRRVARAFRDKAFRNYLEEVFTHQQVDRRHRKLYATPVPLTYSVEDAYETLMDTVSDERFRGLLEAIWSYANGYEIHGKVTYARAAPDEAQERCKNIMASLVYPHLRREVLLYGHTDVVYLINQILDAKSPE